MYDSIKLIYINSGLCLNPYFIFKLYINFVTLNNFIDIMEYVIGIYRLYFPPNYLGLLTLWGRKKSHSLAWIGERILQKSESWKEKLLSQAGKEVLVKSII